MLGINIEENYTQITYCSDESEEFFALEEQEGVGKVKNELFYASRTKSWYSGQEAKEKQETEEGVFFDCAWKERLLKEIPIQIEEQEYQPEDLFLIMIACHIQKLPLRKKACIVITASKQQILSIPFEEKLPTLLKRKEITVFRISQMTAYLSFVLHQEECRGVKATGLFDYREGVMTYYHLGRTAAQDMFKIDSIELNAKLKQAKGDNLDEKFADVLSELFLDWKPSVIYLTGEGFQDSWLNHSLKILCKGRRAFLGQNLYTRGAGYFAIEEVRKKNPKLIAKGLCQYDLGVVAFVEGRDCFISLLEGGCDWYGRQGKLMLLLEDEQSLEFVYLNLRTKQLHREIIALEGMPKRPPMTTRVEIEAVYTSDKEGYLKIRDLGFGTMYPSSELVWIHRLEFAEENTTI